MLPYKNPLGFKNLRTWQQACEIFELTEKFAATLPTKNPQTGQYLTDLKDQMIRSGRSGVRNIEEGFARTTTREYVSFLGFSKGSLEELLGDFEYCLKNNLGDPELARRAIYLLRGEGKMLFNQIKALENKMIKEKTLPREELARQILRREEERIRRDDRYVANLIQKTKGGDKGKAKGV